MKTTLVLGGGGVVGLAYHAGVLRALEVEAGLAPSDADLIVGTSAGSVVGAYLRAGWTTEDFWQLALGTHPRLAAIRPDGSRETAVMPPAFRTPVGLARRGVGAAFVLGQSLLRLPMPPVPGLLGHVFPGGLFDMAAGRRRFESELPAAWPERDLWLTTFDIIRGRRVVLGRDPAPADLDLPRSVRASCAIPGFYPPVRAGRMMLVDGGVRSPTNLDLAASAPGDLVVCVAPIAYERGPGLPTFAHVAREWPQRMLQREAAAVRRSGAEVLLIRPTMAEVRTHGLNLMRSDGVELVARMAYDATARALGTRRFRTSLERLAA